MKIDQCPFQSVNREDCSRRNVDEVAGCWRWSEASPRKQQTGAQPDVGVLYGPLQAEGSFAGGDKEALTR